MLSNIAIDAKGLAKAYVLGEQNTILSRRRDSERNTHWALDDISFEIHHGEAVGIIGHNGAGKSTLLKLLSRITEPTRGRATIYGRVASLLEVGTGFHPELTGRENIFMNGSILGMRRSEITKHFDEITDFADIEKFIDTPVKRYSSGMQMRLAFSVAAHLQPEILIVDEVLAVGDVQFQKKCMGKMGDVSRSGRTVLFVSHNMAAVRQLTTRCILLSRGKIAYDGEPGKAIERYADAMATAFSQGADLSSWPRKTPAVDRVVEIASLKFENSANVFSIDEAIRFKISLSAREAIQSVRLSGSVMHAEGYAIGTFWSGGDAHFDETGVRDFVVDLGELRLSPGMYSFQLAVGIGNESTGHRDFDLINEVLPFEVAAIDGDGGMLGAWHHSWGGIRFPVAKLIAVN
jgi:lipopolysaccharide transport system ATP-binding protein